VVVKVREVDVVLVVDREVLVEAGSS